MRPDPRRAAEAAIKTGQIPVEEIVQWADPEAAGPEWVYQHVPYCWREPA